ncbi:ABC transporter ATP-binding protein [Xanthobacter dioxanivorans]|uniref:ABC transporter ATP-binding protein n=1 Tax=Xanthobacter dioxanivorans TaxID=2528964 RepID=A0A974SGS2_9HYPH|nr:ABC transporter ATP-binding protein [Xanthobacter dioxanivorans]QRG05561.1 ABC transporter ATP-binding protein [Xanthobacter dioxanivorans]
MLEVKNISVRFGGLMALNDASFQVGRGTVHALIGPNGAGKTTMFNVISGVQRPDAGRILVGGADITKLPLHRRASCGMARTFQNIRLFSGMNVIENVMCGMHPTLFANPVLSILGIGKGRAEERRCHGRCLEILALVGLADVAYSPVTALSYGHQRRVEIARALASDPALLLLDEPAAGMNPSETRDLARLLVTLRQGGLTLVVVEHDLHFVMKLSDKITVLNFGRVLADGAPLAVRNDPRVIDAYLGSSAASMKESA